MNSNKDIIIGIECHIQLDTDSKLFCGCATKGTDQPNTRTCEVCLGMPGSKPVINKKAVDYALRLCIALNCKINPQLIFSRKSYFYPDMSKNYQITQYEEPLGSGGKIVLSNGKEIGITRVHLEEDPAALIHTGSMATSPFVLVDYNRSGNPLCEIVTEPELNSPEEARDFMKKLMTLLNYLGVFDSASGIIKADVNVSIKESGYIRSEIKNITGFKEIERALFYEVDRQKKAFEQNEKLLPDTRAWDAAKGMTYRMRVKEKEEDYGYIFEPDLVVTDITKDWVEAVKKELPELAEEKVRKFIKKHKIPEIDAQVLAAERVLAELFEKVAEEIDPVLAAKWLRRELVRVVNYTKQNLKDLLIDEQHMIELLSMVEKGQITETVAQKILEEMIVKPFSPKEYVKKHKLEAVSEVKVLEKYCKEAIKENPQAVQDAKAGKAQALNFLVGKVMAKTKGKATPKEVNEILRKLI
jgi:aspartyl-tRNA(Asn)/glutamyl-tRNA(Gln) amidotransferase subunit B